MWIEILDTFKGETITILHKFLQKQKIHLKRKQDCELTMLPLLQMVTKEETEEKGSFTDDFISLALP